MLIERAEEELRARAVIFAAGSRPKKLGVPGEAEFEENGVSHCADCDGPFYKGQAVVGATSSLYTFAKRGLIARERVAPALAGGFFGSLLGAYLAWLTNPAKLRALVLGDKSLMMFQFY